MSDRCDECVYSSSAPYPMRRMRVSPPELARECPGPYASRSATRCPRFARCHAVHAPKTPAPITATSYVFCILVQTHPARSEEHTSELQSRGHLVCRLLLEKKKINNLLLLPRLRSIRTHADDTREK